MVRVDELNSPIELKQGDAGEQVVNVQLWLMRPDNGGIFDAALTEAVKTFQEKNGLPITGIVDLATWEALRTQPPVQPRLPAAIPP